MIPGSHVREHPLHSSLRAEAAKLGKGPSHGSWGSLTPWESAGERSPLFGRHPDAVDVCAQAGEVIVGDARLLHGAHSNASTGRRTGLTLWYVDGFEGLPAELQVAAQTAMVAHSRTHTLGLAS